MITANVKFLSNSITTDLTCRESELRSKLNEIGVITPTSVIPLNNLLTLKVYLLPDDEMGKRLCGIINTEADTLGGVQRLCRHIYCLNEQHKTAFWKMLENGKITSIQQGIEAAQRLRRRVRTISR